MRGSTSSKSERQEPSRRSEGQSTSLGSSLAAGGLRLFPFFVALNITFQLVSDVTAAKLVGFVGVSVSISIIYFPVTYVVDDIVTEVYGYGRARMVMWYTLMASVTAGLIYQLAAFYPAASGFADAAAYRSVFEMVPRVLLGSWLALFAGDIANNYVISRLKVLTNGKRLWLRLVTSTVVGQLVNTIVFNTVAFAGELSLDMLLPGIVLSWLFKIAVELVMMPLTYKVIAYVKRVEGVDAYDRHIDYNPLLLRS